MTLEGIIKEYERMKEAVDFVYGNGIFPNEEENDESYELIFRYNTYNITADFTHTFSYCFKANTTSEDGILFGAGFGTYEPVFPIEVFNSISSFISAMFEYRKENNGSMSKMYEFINYLEKERKKDNAEI